nr:hypothetical protein [uncultured Carboxylicivirga sp.]
MKTTSAYHQIVKWQKANNICIGDQITFLHKSRKRSGFLTGFDMENNPMKLIVRYISGWGLMQIATINREDVISKCSYSRAV